MDSRKLKDGGSEEGERRGEWIAMIALVARISDMGTHRRLSGQ